MANAEAVLRERGRTTRIRMRAFTSMGNRGLEDAEADFRLIVRHLRHRGFDADCQRVVRLEESDRALTFDRISGYESAGTVYG